MVNNKILIITYYWPPSGGSGVQRWLSFSNSLVNMGYDVTVLTAEFPDYPLIDMSLKSKIDPLIKVLKVPVFEPAKFFKSKKTNSDNIEGKGILNYLKLFIRSNFFFPDSRMFWINDVVNTASSFINKNNINCVITTSPPFSLNIIGFKLKLRNDIKWISDHRDPWSDFFQFKNMPMFNYVKNKHTKWEERCLRLADSVIVTSPSLKKTYSKINNNTHLITNGFNDIEDTYANENFGIIYSGVMKSSQNPKMLWKVLYEISKANKSFSKDFSLKLIGSFDKSIHQNKYLKKLKENVVFEDYMSKDTLAENLSIGKVFILCDVDQLDGGNLIPGKFFHYLSYKIPIVAFSSIKSDTYNIVKETKSGNVFEFSNEIDLKNHILELYSNFKNGNCLLSSSDIEKYKYSNLSLELRDIINKINN
ncbi:glycosyltransferase family 4 protein [Flavobacteriaceae bacterium]|nr:glycosyltransferase family 4 protein [Flavobacteriaceae bacterium]MDC0117292.1 glycosyltransferase family 4 protein [Flavobacteriaceae bacterium]